MSPVRRVFGLLALLLPLTAPSLSAQQPAPPGSATGSEPDPGPGISHLVTTGRVSVNGGFVPYTVRHLPVSSFPELPAPVVAELTRRGCLIPQTYEAHGPENVIRGSFERAGSADWAVLCSVVRGLAVGRVSLLVFFASNLATPATLATASETDRLQPRPGSSADFAEWGFNWGIDPASPHRLQEAQNGLEASAPTRPGPRPAPFDHDALADSVIERRTVYHYYAKGVWSALPLPD
jgi:hypothetical protein